MRRILFILALALLIPMSSVSAANNSGVKIPHSASEWAKFSPVEKALATAWVWRQSQVLNIEAILDAQVSAQVSASQKSGVASASTILTPSGGIDCGIAVNNQAWGSYTYGWAQAYATATMYSIDTGITNRNAGYWDTLYRNGNYVQSVGSSGGGTHAYAQTVQDFKWAWETLTYSIQAYGTAEWKPGIFIFRLKSCFKAQSV